MFIITHTHHITCSELSTVKIHANTMVFSLTANSPMIHVMPNRGSNITALLTDDLYQCTASF